MRRALDRTAAQRVRRYRARQRLGRVAVMVDIDEVNAAEALIEIGELDPLKADDRRELAAALERFIDRVFAVTS